MSDEITPKADITPEEAIQVLQTLQQDKITAAGKEVNEVLKKYGMSLQIVQNISIVPAQ